MLSSLPKLTAQPKPKQSFLPRLTAQPKPKQSFLPKLVSKAADPAPGKLTGNSIGRSPSANVAGYAQHLAAQRIAERKQRVIGKIPHLPVGKREFISLIALAFAFITDFHADILSNHRTQAAGEIPASQRGCSIRQKGSSKRMGYNSRRGGCRPQPGPGNGCSLCGRT